jgi:hypothetical protein
MTTPSLHVALSDQRVLPLQDKSWLKHPILAKYEALFATAYVEPPYSGPLPDGTTGKTNHPLVQFIISSQHPRPIQRKHGINHVNIATAWRNAWDESEKDRARFVQGGAIDPAERIFAALAQKHASDLKSLESITN